MEDMKRIFTSKRERKQAEDAIIRDMRVIQKRLKDHKRKTEEPIDKDHVQSVLIEFMKIKKETNIIM